MTTEHQLGRPVTAEQAHESHQRLVDHFFGNEAERPRVSIPARLDRDDDLVVSRYIDQAEAELRTLRARVGELEACLTDLHLFAGRGDGHETAGKVTDCIAGVIIQLRSDLARAESAEARVKEFEAAMWTFAAEVESRDRRITDLESQLAAARSKAEQYEQDWYAAKSEFGTAAAKLRRELAAAREEQGLEAKVREALGERLFSLKIEQDHGLWWAIWDAASDVHDMRLGLGKHERIETLPALLRAILEVEAKDG